MGISPDPHGSCDDPNHFYMDINVQNPPYIWPGCFEQQGGRMRTLTVRGLCGLFEALSGKTVVFMARIEGVHGIVTRKFSQVFTAVPDEGPDEHVPALLSATASTFGVRFGNIWRRESAIQQQTLHPNYLVFVGTTRVNADYMPGARAFYIDAEVGPDASKADSERLFRFDLSCLTRIRPCSRQDLMPAVSDQYEIDVRHLATPAQR
jgi:hypothetical protein